MPDDGMGAEGQAAPGADAGAPSQDGQPQAAGGEAQPAQQQEPTIQDVLKQLTALQPHIGRISALQSKLDSIPKNLEDMVSKRFDAWTRQNQLNQLPPDQRKAFEDQQAQYEEDRKVLNKLIEEQLEKMLPDKFGASIEAGQAYQDSKAAKGFFTEIEGELGPEESTRIAPYINELLKKNEEEIKSPDPSVFQKASEWLDKALKNPSSVALQALRMAQEAVQKGADNVVEQRAQRGRALGAAPRPGSSPTPPKSLKGLNPKEIEDLASNMTTEEYEKLLKASKGG